VVALTIKQELVTQTNANLFRAVPSLTPLTIQGATNIHPSPDGHKIAFAVASASSTLKNGLYILELSSGGTISSPKSPRQIAASTSTLDFSTADILWSPDSTELLVHFAPTPTNTSTHLLDVNGTSNLPQLPDVTIRLALILAEWEEQLAIEETRQFNLLPPAFQQIATQSSTNIFFSPNNERLMYTATASATLPDNLIERPLITNTQPENRVLEAGNLYVYDLKEDRNFLIEQGILTENQPTKDLLLLPTYQQQDTSAATASAQPSPINQITYNRLFDPTSIPQTFANFRLHYAPLYTQNFQWYPQGSHLIITLPGKIDIIEHDSTNWVTLYSGPFEQNFTFPWPDGNKLVILTNLNPTSNTPPNLYSVDIK